MAKHTSNKNAKSGGKNDSSKKHGDNKPGKAAKNSAKAGDKEKGHKIDFPTDQPQTNVSVEENTAPAPVANNSPEVNEFVPDAPESHSQGENPQGSSDTARAGESAPIENSAPSAPESPRAEEAAPVEVKEEPKVPTAASGPVIDDRLKNVGPLTAHSDELKLEKFLAIRNNPKSISDSDLGKSGINMRKLSLLHGKIGKFRLKRAFSNGKWSISVVEG